MSKQFRILITGGAGFIGSNLVEKCIANPQISLVRVVDDLSNGYYENIERFINHPKFEFIQNDICDYQVCLAATKGIDKVSHQAALGSVPRSVENPMRSTEVNILGSVNLMHACYVNGVERIILACSSSTYGDSAELPKVESRIGAPLSPYAVTKSVLETFADVFNKTYGLKYIGLRYFNVFGPRQNPNNAYAAVLPVFCKAFIEDRQPLINGDGGTSRDFTFIENALHANDLALFSENHDALNQVYNVACGEQYSLNQIIDFLNQITNKKIVPVYGPERKGDIRHSMADITKIKTMLGYQVQENFLEGLRKTYAYYLSC
jgi:UDP-N-acetylglucosamine 4-epimerase